jgi:hypothetical protein
MFEFGWNTNGAAITAFELFDNGKMIENDSFLSEFEVFGNIADGHHSIVAKIFDTAGHSYSATTSFTQVGFDPPFGCSTPATPGIHLCQPPSGSLRPWITPVYVSIKGAAAITNWSVFVNGKLQESDPTTHKSPLLFGTSVSARAGANSLTITANDAKGHKYSVTHQYTAFLTDFECAPKGGGCTPGIEIEQPTTFDPPQSFRFQSTVRDNPAPITSTTVYLDGKKVASSNGPLVLTTIHAAHGSHIVTVISKDTKGHFYQVSPTYNVN